MRTHRRPTVDIELVAPDDGQSEWTEPLVDDHSVSWRPVVVIAAMLVCGLAMLRMWPATPDRTDRSSQPELPYQLTFVPGPDRPVFADVSGASVLYVNSDGAPTLIDLDTGDRSELHIAAAADMFIFMVEKGRVVTDSPAAGSDIRAGDRAFSLMAYRTSSPGSAEQSDRQAMAMVPICSEFGCSILGRGPTLGRGGDVLRLVSDRTDPVVASLFDPSVWSREGAWMLAPAGSELDLRLPAPAAHSPIYLVHQP